MYRFFSGRKTQSNIGAWLRIYKVVAAAISPTYKRYYQLVGIQIQISRPIRCCLMNNLIPVAFWFGSSWHSITLPSIRHHIRFIFVTHGTIFSCRPFVVFASRFRRGVPILRPRSVAWAHFGAVRCPMSTTITITFRNRFALDVAFDVRCLFGFYVAKILLENLFFWFMIVVVYCRFSFQ